MHLSSKRIEETTRSVRRIRSIARTTPWPARRFRLQPPVDSTAKLHDTALGAYCEVGARTILHEVTMGDYSYVVNDSADHLHDDRKVLLDRGDDADQSRQSSDAPRDAGALHLSRQHLFPGREPTTPHSSTGAAQHHVNIGHDVWIGHGAIMLPGRNIGTGAVIAAGAVVTKDVPAYTIVAGNPAPHRSGGGSPRHIAERLAALAWWDWDHEALRTVALPDFRKLAVGGVSSTSMNDSAPPPNFSTMQTKCPIVTDIFDRRRPRRSIGGDLVETALADLQGATSRIVGAAAATARPSTLAACWCCPASSTSMAMPSSGR